MFVCVLQNMAPNLISPKVLNRLCRNRTELRLAEAISTKQIAELYLSIKNLKTFSCRFLVRLKLNL